MGLTVGLKLENSLKLKLVLMGNFLLLRQMSVIVFLFTHVPIKLC